MSLKKRLTAVLALVLVLAIAVIVGNSGMTLPEKSQDSAFHKKETIYFWYTDDALTDYVNSAAVNFGETYGVRVIPVLKSGMEYLEAVNEASLDDTVATPDVYLLSNDSLGKAYMAGLAAKVQDGGVCDNTHFPKAALSAVTCDGQIVAYPYYYETSTYLYNKTYLEDFIRAKAEAEAQTDGQDVQSGEDGQEAQSTEDGQDGADGQEASDAQSGAEETAALVDEVALQQLLPKTMDELLSFADAYDAPENVEAILKWDVADIFYNYYFIGKYMVVGGEAGDDASQIDIYNLETIQCLKAYQKLNQFFYIEPDTVSYDSVLQEFIEGKIVFTVVTNDALARLEQAKEDGSMTFEYGIMPVPQISDTLEGRSLSVTNAVVVNGYSDKQALANRFAKYLTTEYVDTLYSRTGKSAASYDAPYENENLSKFMAEYEKSIPMPKMIETSNFWVQLEILFAKVWNGENINDLVRTLSEQMMTQVTGQPYTEEYIEEPEEETVEEGEYVDDGSEMGEDDVTAQ